MLRRLVSLLALLAAPALAQVASPSPKLVVAISVDQLSADLFNEYRPYFTDGLRRLATQSVLFPNGYQGHAATETCPGHSTILTGNRPARTGIAANAWIDQSLARADKSVNCAEDPRLGKSSKGEDYVPALINLRVPTLGDRLKQASPQSRVVSVAGKDRAAMMMGGARTDQLWFLRPADYIAFETLRSATSPRPAAINRVNAAITSALAAPVAPLPLPAQCQSRSVPVAVDTRTLGTGRFGRAAGERRLWRASPESDVATLDLAAALVAEQQLGRRGVTDLLAIGLSATDIVGHAYGTGGSEMCIQLAALDRMLGRFLDTLDASGVDYMVVLTADHGGHDTPERNRQRAVPDDQRIAADLSVKSVSAGIERALKLKVPALLSAETSNIAIGRDVPRGKRAQVLKRALAFYRAQPQVYAAYTAEEILATPMPTALPENWTLLERERASFVPGRSGDIVLVLKPRVTPIAAGSPGYIATHGSPWDYDRRVPILFWRKGLMPFEQPNSVETIDIAPTLAALLGLSVPAGDFDGRCLDLDPGAASTCR